MSVDSGMDNVTHTHTMKYHSATEKKETAFGTTWVDLEDIMLSENQSNRERHILCNLIYM